jgi:hypothetical protein
VATGDRSLTLNNLLYRLPLSILNGRNGWAVGERLKLAVLVDASAQGAGRAELLARLLAVLGEAEVPCGLVGAEDDANEAWLVDVGSEASAAGASYVPRVQTDPPIRFQAALAATPAWVIEAARRVLVIPYAADLSDRVQALPWGWTPDEWLQYLMDAFDRLDDEAQSTPRLLVLLLHPEHSGRAGAVQALQQFLRYVAEREGAVWCNPVDLAMEVRAWL